jgi:hypothetical protein
MSFSDLRSLKHDRCVATEGSYKRVFAPLFSLPPEKYPSLSEAIQALKRWSGCAEPEDTLTALVMVTHAYLEKAMKLRLVEALILGYQPTEREVLWALRKACRILRRKHGSLYPRWESVLRHGRGGVEVGVGGFPESLEARHWRWEEKKGRFYVIGGDGFIYWVQWGPEGQKIWGIQPYGASHVSGSPHYADQVMPFANQRLFLRSLDWDYLRQHATRVYHPSR